MGPIICSVMLPCTESAFLVADEVMSIPAVVAEMDDPSSPYDQDLWKLKP